MYEGKSDDQVFYVLPVESVLGELPLVPIGNTGTIPFAMRQHAEYTMMYINIKGFNIMDNEKNHSRETEGNRWYILRGPSS